MPRPLSLSRRILTPLAVWTTVLLLRLLASTWRISYASKDLPRERFDANQRFLGLFWHNRILALLWETRHRGVTALISRHRDGDVMATVAAAFGHRAARGSSTRGAVGGLKGLLDAAESGTIAITPDGPKGPPYQFQRGGAELAIKTGLPAVIATYAVDRCWHARSWDGFIVPKPFARVVFRYRDIPLPPGTDGGAPDLETVRCLLEKELRDLTRDAEDALLGTHDARLDGPPGTALSGREPAQARGLATALPPARALSGRLIVACALAPALAVALLPRLFKAGLDPRANLAGALLLASGFAALLGPALALVGAGAPCRGGGNPLRTSQLRAPSTAAERGPTLLLAIALAIGTVAALLPEGTALLGTAALGLLYPLSLLLLGTLGAGLLGRMRLAPLLAAIPPLGFLLSIFAVGPLLSLVGAGGRALALLLHVSAVTALTGSLLEIDLLRAAPLYQLVPAASEAPFRYPDFPSTLAAPVALALLLGCLSFVRRKRPLLALTDAPS